MPDSLLYSDTRSSCVYSWLAKGSGLEYQPKLTVTSKDQKKHSIWSIHTLDLDQKKHSIAKLVLTVKPVDHNGENKIIEGTVNVCDSTVLDPDLSIQILSSGFVKTDPDHIICYNKTVEQSTKEDKRKRPLQKHHSFWNNQILSQISSKGFGVSTRHNKQF